MEPTEHVLIALIPVVAYSLLRYRRLPRGLMVLTAVFAGLFADIVDKPLAWTVGVIPSGRVFAHSIVLSSFLLVCVIAVGYWNNKLAYSAVFTWGHLSHIAGDFYPVLYRGSDFYWYPNLFWPLTQANPDPNPGFTNHAPTLGMEAFVELTVLILVIAYIAFDIRRQFWHHRKLS